jgi:hypothetical protein
MLKMIIANSPALIAFIAALELSLSAPQYRHVLNVVESLIVGEGVKTLSGLNNNGHIRELLASGRRITEFPSRRMPEEERALEGIQLVPAAQVERALDQVAMMKTQVEQAGRSAREIEQERGQALVALVEKHRGDGAGAASPKKQKAKAG